MSDRSSAKLPRSFHWPNGSIHHNQLATAVHENASEHMRPCLGFVQRSASCLYISPDSPGYQVRVRVSAKLPIIKDTITKHDRFQYTIQNTLPAPQRTKPCWAVDLSRIQLQWLFIDCAHCARRLSFLTIRNTQHQNHSKPTQGCIIQPSVPPPL